MLESRSESMEFMSNERILELAPTVFANTPSNSVSDKYTHIPTSKVIEDMRLLGWGVVETKEVKARTTGTKGFQKHLLIFRNPEISITGKDGDDVYPQILLTNSHDGKNAFTFKAGLFRLVCTNGLVIATDTFEDVKIRHMGYTFEELQTQIHEMVEKLPLTVTSMNSMKETELGQEQALEFAKKALDIRYGDNKVEVDLVEFLEPTRVEDEGSDLWSRFNIVQERLLSGDFEYATSNKPRKARKIKNFKQDMDINSKLFELALEYVN